MGTIRKPILKAKALQLRSLGYSYNMIINELGLSKSTLSDWLGHIPFEPSQKMTSRISAGRTKSAETKKFLKLSNINEAKQLAKREVGRLTSRDLFMLGIAIYYGEGSKSNEDVRVVNSDPALIKFAVAWFKKCCFLDINNFAPRIHLYPDCNERESKNYWAGITGIPTKQFQKTQVDERVNKSSRGKNKLKYGTLHLQIRSRGNPLHGRFLHRRIMGWIQASMDQL